MKRIKNEKGFTLIELLAVIIILAVIMTVAIPNVVATLEKNKKDSFIKDAKNAITSCEYTIRSEKKYEYPDESTAVIFPISEIKNLDLGVSSYDTYYSQSDSFVAITKDKVGESYEYMYYIHLVSCTDKKCENLEDNSALKNRGINLVDSFKIDGSSRFDLVVKGDDVVISYLRDAANNYPDLKVALKNARIANSENSYDATNNESATITNIVVY